MQKLTANNPPINGEAIVLITIGILLIIALIVYSVLFFAHRLALNKEYSLKQQYNRILQFTLAYKFKYLEALAKHNPQLKIYSDNLHKNKVVFESHLNVVQSKLMSLTTLNADFLYFKARRLIKIITTDLTKCVRMVEYFKNISISATKYSKSIGDVLTQYRTITNWIINFYELHLALRYDHEVINNMVKLIDENFVNAKALTNRPENNVELFHAVSELNKHITKMYQLVGELYILDHILMFLFSQQKHLDQLVKEHGHRLSSPDHYSVDRYSATAKTNITNMSVALKNLNFGEARGAAIVAIKHFNSAISKVETGEITNLLVQKNMTFLSAQIAILKKDLKEITIAFNNIKRFFNTKDQLIIDKIYRLSAKLKNIDYFYQSLESDYHNFENIQREEFLIKVRALVWDLIAWRDSLNHLIVLVQERYRTSININNELSEVKLILSQLLGIKLRFNSNDVKSLDGIKNIIVHVDNLQTQLSANYFANYKTVNDELNKVKEQVILLIQSSSLDETLKLFTKRIIFFLNKYRYEAKEIDEVLNMAEKYYIDGNFQDGIDLLIDVLVNIKESAKVNRITFN